MCCWEKCTIYYLSLRLTLPSSQQEKSPDVRYSPDVSRIHNCDDCNRQHSSHFPKNKRSAQTKVPARHSGLVAMARDVRHSTAACVVARIAARIPKNVAEEAAATPEPSATQSRANAETGLTIPTPIPSRAPSTSLCTRIINPISDWSASQRIISTLCITARRLPCLWETVLHDAGVALSTSAPPRPRDPRTS